MDSTKSIMIIIWVCFIMIIATTFSKPLKLILKFLFNVLWGSAILTFINSMGFSIGANVFTAITIGFLGIPGLAGLIAVNLIL